MSGRQGFILMVCPVPNLREAVRGFFYHLIPANHYCNYLYTMNIQLRPIQPGDNPVIAKIIRDTLTEFGANHPGTVYYDPTTDALYELFQTKKAHYNIAILDGQIVGGGGIYPTEGLPDDTCELVKMYLLTKARGTGLGKKLIEAAIDAAITNGFKKMYLETMPELKPALGIYTRFGFEYLDGPMGNSGHTGCTLWMMKTLY